MITLIGSFKGGSGKSTVTFNLGIWLSTAGKQVLACDLDPQCTLTDAVDIRKEEGLAPGLTVYQEYRKQYAAEAEELVIDVGTADMDAMKAALTITDRVVMPVGPSQADIWSAQRFLYLISSLKRKHPLELIAFINRADTNRMIQESNQTEAVLSALPGVNVLKKRLCHRTAYRRSFSEGMGVFELEPDGKAAWEFQAFARKLYPEAKQPAK